jgi:hypothetical protein
MRESHNFKDSVLLRRCVQELMSSGVRPSSTKRKLILVSGRDRAKVEESGIEHLAFFLDKTSPQSGLQNAFPLLAVAFSDKAEADLKESMASLRALGTVPEIPLQRLDEGSREEACGLVRALLEGGIGRLSRYASSIAAELAILRRERETLLDKVRFYRLALERGFPIPPTRFVNSREDVLEAMVEIDPEAEEVLERLQELAERLSAGIPGPG